jgi:biopolymer transport protein TolQ
MKPFVFAQVGQAVPTTPWEMVTQASTIEQGVLLVLAVLSLVSWMIILAKAVEFRRVRRAGERFMSDFERAQTLDEAISAARRAPAGPFSRVFERARLFLVETVPAIGGTSERAARFSGSQVEALRFVLDSETSAERDHLARFLPWLATIGSASPLLGLLGTVFGIIDAFLGVATTGSGNLAAVAPGVAIALTATAAALAVAIPAVFGYNIFANRLNRVEGDLEGFGSELIALLVREGRI